MKRKINNKMNQELKSEISQSKPKMAQELKLRKILWSDFSRKKAQEEMVGFALIIIIVAVILLIFLGIALSNKPTTKESNYQVQNFLESALQYTTECQGGYENNLDLKGLIAQCGSGEQCTNEKNSCDVLNSTMTEILKESWKPGKENLIKGYSLNIEKDGNNLKSFIEGVPGTEIRPANSDFTKKGSDYLINLEIYY